VDFLPETAGPHNPLGATPQRAAGSIRRTAHIDSTRPEGLDGDVVVDARARDLRTSLDGGSHVVAEATLQARISPTRRLVSIRSSPDLPGLASLIGAPLGSGFRARVDQAIAGECENGSLLYLLLDDLSVATMVSGYAVMRAGGAKPAPARIRSTDDPEVTKRDDVCAGWAHDATMMVHLRETGALPVPLGPPAPLLEADDDPVSWHTMAPLPPHGVRRRRRLDLMSPVDLGADHQVDLHFRDSHADEVGNETVLHEYSVTAAVDAAAGRIVAVTAEAQVLPWLECPAALASAQRISGMELAELRPRVRKEFVGRSTCTHLNDCLRSLADITTLLDELP